MTIWICSIRLTPAWWSRGMICWSAPVPLSPSFIVFPPTPSPFPLSLSLSLFFSLFCFFLSFVAFQVFSSLCRCPFFSEISCLSRSFPLQPPSSPFLSLSLSLSFALCVRVCRWLLLAGSVTRGNWGRVHFNRTNGNKLIHFHCCFFFFFFRDAVEFQAKELKLRVLKKGQRLV